MKKLRACTLLMLIVFFPLRCVGDEGVLSDRIFSPSIHTVELYRTGWRLSRPILVLGEENTLSLDFDDLSDTPENYRYTFIHCDALWHPSDLLPSDYLDGFVENNLRDYESSVNTTVPYVHYHLTFPNEDIRFRLTGNYVIKVFRDDPDAPVLTARFFITSNEIRIRGEVVEPGGPDRFRQQQLLLTVDYGNLPLRSPADELYVVVQQNGRWDNILRGPRPSSSGGGRLVFGTPSAIIFPGGNEYRNLDLKSIRYQSPGIARIEYKAPYYNILLKPSELRSMKPYLTQQDLNGRFFIENSRGSDADTDADYVNVFFSLPVNFPFEGKVHLFGALTGWQCGPAGRMQYDMQQHRYVATLLLKQGMYNYAYAVKKEHTGPCDLTLIEGSHYETENEYLILIYYREAGERYDRLVGTTTVSSRKIR